MEVIWALWGVNWLAPFVYASSDWMEGNESRDSDGSWSLVSLVDGTMESFGPDLSFR